MSEATPATAIPLTLEEPEALNVQIIVRTRGKGAKYVDGAYRVETPGFTVVGTNKLFAVYRIPVKVERWGLVHVPSGAPVFAKFRIREEAEEFASWMWLNAIHRDGLTATKTGAVSEALGARIRSRVKDGNILHGHRAARSRALGTSLGQPSETERLLLERAAQLRLHIADTTKVHEMRLKSFNEKELLLERERIALRDRRTAAEKREKEQDACQANLNQVASNQQEQQRAWTVEQQELMAAQNQVATIRNQLAGAIALLVGEDQESPAVLRSLRGVRVRGHAMDDDTGADGS